MKILLYLSLLILAPLSLGQLPDPQLRPELVGAHSTRAIAVLVPEKGKHKHLFDSYMPGIGAAWSRQWPSKVNLTGVAWDIPQAGVLISPRHVACAKHMGRAMNQPIVFTDPKGNEIKRELVKAEAVGAAQGLPDILLFLLDEAVPETIKPLRVLPPREGWAKELAGSRALYTDQERKLMVTTIGGFDKGMIGFTKNQEVDPFYQEEIIMGDSAKPSFLLISGEPILIETHSFGGWGVGPFFSDPEVFRLVNEAMAKLDGHYQLSTIPLKGIPADNGRRNPAVKPPPPAPPVATPGIPAPPATAPSPAPVAPPAPGSKPPRAIPVE